MQQNNFWYLLVALLIFIFAVPDLYDLGLISLRGSRVLAIVCVLAVGVWSLVGSGRLFQIGMAMAVAGVVLNVLAYVRESDTLQISSMLVLFAFLVLATVSAAKQVASHHDFSTNRIVGAVCIYLMLGVMWSIAYSSLEFAKPGSFRGLTELASAGWNPDWTYFSFVTLTTLGYGDITPVTQTARSLALAEAVAGQFYLAILVAGIVSAYISARRDGGDNQ